MKQNVFNDVGTSANTNQPISAQAQYYVYALIDPQTNEIFYIGKGKNQRVLDHIKEAKDSFAKKKEQSPKVQRILKILNHLKSGPKFVFLRTGLSEDAAYELEGMMIDFLTCGDYNFSGIADLQNAQDGHHNDTNGMKTMDDLQRLINAKEAIIKDGEKIIAISINASYFLAHRKVYDAVRSSWKINVNRAKRADYVVAVFQGVIVGVYENVVWRKVSHSDRHEFTANDVLNKNVLSRLSYHKWVLGFGSGHPIRYNYL